MSGISYTAGLSPDPDPMAYEHEAATAATLTELAPFRISELCFFVGEPVAAQIRTYSMVIV